MKLSKLVGYFYYLWEVKSIWKKSKPLKQLFDALDTNSLTLMTVLKICSEIFPWQIWQEIEWFNVFLVISEASQGYESKAYGVLNHNLKLQSKKIFAIFQHKVERTPHFTRVTEVRHMGKSNISISCIKMYKSWVCLIWWILWQFMLALMEFLVALQ